MAMASLSASLLARKGTARPVGNENIPSGDVKTNRIQFVPHDVPRMAPQNTSVEKKPDMEKQTVNAIRRSAKKNQAIGKTDQKTNKSKRKSVRLSTPIDKDLRLLAAGLGISQQSIMESAIREHITRLFNDRGCVCGSRINGDSLMISKQRVQ